MMMNRTNTIVEINESDVSSDESDFEATTPHQALLSGALKVYKFSSTRRSSILYHRETSYDAHSYVDKNSNPNEFDFNIQLRFKKAIDGCEEYFTHWSEKCSKDKKLFQEFKKYEKKESKLTVLHYAALHARKEICEILLKEFKFDPDVKAEKNLTPLHLLVKCNKLKTSNTNTSQNDLNLSSSTPRSRASTLRNTDDVKGTMELLLQNSANVDAEDAYGFTALHYAAMKDNHIVARDLINIANTKKRDDQLMTPLHVACKYGSTQVCHLLLEIEDVKTIATSLDAKDCLPLHHLCACKVEKLTMLQKMLNKIQLFDQANQTNYLKLALAQKNCRNKTALHLCIENNHHNLVTILCKHYNANVNEQGGYNDNFPIHMAAKVGSIEMMEILKEGKAKMDALNKKNENLLHVAASANQTKFISKFLDYENQKRKTPNMSIPAVHITNFRQQTPLLCAAIYGNTDCMDILLKKGNANICDKDINENTIFHLGALYNNMQIFEYLLNPGSTNLPRQNYLSILKQTDKSDNTVVHVACRCGHLDILKFIFSSESVDSSMTELVFAKNNDEQTGFHIACAKGHYNIVNYFLRKYNPSPLIQDIDEDFNTGLHLASQSGHHEIVSLLIKYGASVEARNNKDWSPLDIASYYGEIKVAEILLKHDASMHTQGCKTYPLLLASGNGKNEIVKLLLSYNASIYITDEQNRNCLDLALENDHKDVVVTILNDKNWTQVIHKKGNHMQYENLIFKMPDTMEIILNQIENKKNQNKKYDFRALDLDIESIDRHPLKIMATSRHENLLKHNITQKLIELKWKKCPQYFYFGNLFLYCVFVILLTTHVIMSNKIHEQNETNSSNSSHHEQHTEHNVLIQDVFVYSLTLIFLILHIFKELAQLITEGFSYFRRFDNIIELLTYILTFMFLIPLPHEFCDYMGHSNDHFELQGDLIVFHRCHLQWQIGSVSILLAWIVFVFFIEKLKIFGKYIVMFHKVLINSFQFFPVFFLFIFGFALSFSMLFGNKHKDFDKVPTAIMKTLSMMIGELDFTEIFIEKSWANYVVYALFVAIMCIIIFNLLVGLAVGDINKVETDAYVEFMSMKIDFILKVQQKLHNKCCGFKIVKSNFMRFDVVDADVKIDRFENCLNVIFKPIRKIFNDSNSNNELQQNLECEANSRDNLLIKAIEELQNTITINNQNVYMMMSKMKNDVKMLKTQLKNADAKMVEIKKSIMRQRCISN